MKIRIEGAVTNSNCDHAGCSGGWASGYYIEVDGKEIKDLNPPEEPSCFGEKNYYTEDLFEFLNEVFKKSDINLTIEYME